MYCHNYRTDPFTFDTYILSQAAIPSSSYDEAAPVVPALTNRETGLDITPEWQPMGYRGIYTNLTGRIVNFYNPQDGALALWLDNQRLLKPSANYGFNGTDCFFLHSFDIIWLGDSQETRAMLARSRTLGIGASGPTLALGVIQGGLDLHQELGFSDTIAEHSAQWTRTIQASRPYYLRILDAIAP